MTVTPRQLKIFLALAESLNFSRTAELFFVTQPALSKIVKDLEEQLGVALFERSTRNVRLTSAGERMSSLARRIVGDFENGVQHLQSLAIQESLQVTISSIPSLANVVLPEVCRRLEQNFPAPRFTIYDGTNTSTIRRVVNYEVDFALASVTPSHDGLEYEEIMRDRFVLLAPNGSKSIHDTQVRMQDLVELPLICGTAASTATQYISAAFLKIGVVFQPKLSFEQIATAAGFVRSGQGIVIQPYLGVAPLLDLQDFQLCEIVDGPIRSVGIVTRKGSRLPPIAQRAIAEVRSVADDLIERFPRWIDRPQPT
ncbi:LysR family transcriptional regulator [Ensifer sp. Root31]|nr:LysR family transcriptional regulator [Ensifer sp. Root31]